MWTREQLKRNGKFAFQRNYWPCVGVAFIMDGGVSGLQRRQFLGKPEIFDICHQLL